jgi:uncharacterized protein (TIGR02597 family)
MVSAVTGSTITVQGSPAWTANQFLYATGTQPKTYFVRFTSGARAGAYFTVLGNTASALTIDLNGDSLTTVIAGDRFQITPYWTIASIFPATDVGVSFEATTNLLSRKTEVFFLNQNLVGINPSATATFFYYNNAWRKAGSDIAISFNDSALILPDSYFIVRNKTVPGTLTFVGTVLTSTVELGLNSNQASKQDNLVAISRPVDVSLANSGLIASGAFVPTTNLLSRKDELYVYESTASGMNRTPSATYFYYNNGWRKVGTDISIDSGGDLAFHAGAGVIIRKAANGTGPVTSTWKNAPTY